MKRRKQIAKISRIDIDIYYSKVYIIWGDFTGIEVKLKKDKVHKSTIDYVLGELHNVKSHSDSWGSTIKASSHQSFIYFPDTKIENKVLMTTIAHEVIHVCTNIFKYVGAVHSKDSDECYAYLHSDIMEKILNTIFE